MNINFPLKLFERKMSRSKEIFQWNNCVKTKLLASSIAAQFKEMWYVNKNWGYDKTI